jgi:micrococcal nuclease
MPGQKFYRKPGHATADPGDYIMIQRLVFLALMLISLPVAANASIEASGIVTRVIDGDTIDVQGLGLVSLADVKSPEMGTIEGVHAREYALENLLDVQVFLDKDDTAATNADGSIPCLVYLPGPDGKPNLNKNFNKMIVMAGHAVIKKNSGSEFDPAQW